MTFTFAALEPALASEPASAPSAPLQARIDGLVAAQRSREALPLALERARREDSVAAWAQVRKIADWNSEADAALTALRSLVRLDPAQLGRRKTLAQRLLWAKRTREALPHVRAVLASADERDPLALEVATWVLSAEGALDEARDAAARWARAARGGAESRRARRVLAELLEHSVRWRESRELYASIETAGATRSDAGGGSARSRDRERDAARDRLEALRHAHPSEARVDARYSSDSVGVRVSSLDGIAVYPLPVRATVFGRASIGHWASSRREDAARARGGADLDRARAVAGVRVEASDTLQPDIEGGAEFDSVGHVAPVGEAGIELRAGGVLFARAALRADRHAVSGLSLARDVRATGPRASAYVEPVPWAFGSVEGSFDVIPDGNQRARAVAAVGVHNRGWAQLEPRVFGQLERYRDARPEADPYFTPTEPFSWGGELALRLVGGPRTRAVASLGAVVQDGRAAIRPSFDGIVAIGRHVHAGANASYVGSVEYRQARVGVLVQYLF